MKKSALQKARAAYQPKLPIVLTGAVKAVEGKATNSVADQEDIQKLFPNTYGLPEIHFEKGPAVKSAPINVGVILSGGQAPGGHNVISGLFDGIKKVNRDSRLYGFLMGPGGFVDHKYMELTASYIDEYRNTGGFDIIGSGRTKLETKAQFDKGLEILKELNIKALVIIGGDDSNTNAAILAEYYKSINAGVQVIGCPKTIDGDLKNEMIETSFGFDTATKVYSEVIGNIQRDCNSSKKYWHFIKLMGRSASHIALEFIPAMKALIAELNDLLADNAEEFAKIDRQNQLSWIVDRLSSENASIFNSLPEGVARQLCLDRDPHGNVQVSLIETEKLLGEMVGRRLNEMKAEGRYVGKFASMFHFFGYEGRCADPSNFDADYCYALGYNAACLVKAGVTGYMSSVRNLTKPSVQWIAGGIPITMMMNIERRNAEDKPVIQKALVRLDDRPFQEFAKHRDEWAINTCYTYPGPIQYFGPTEVCDQPSMTLKNEHMSK